MKVVIFIGNWGEIKRSHHRQVYIALDGGMSQEPLNELCVSLNACPSSLSHRHRLLDRESVVFCEIKQRPAFIVEVVCSVLAVDT